MKNLISCSKHACTSFVHSFLFEIHGVGHCSPWASLNGKIYDTGYWFLCSDNSFDNIMNLMTFLFF